ncbi:MAG: inositol-3-phosphate synthase [Pirellulales bacterium]|nr:inositol-3-phosphate synthase [Pirellulales bacterium]
MPHARVGLWLIGAKGGVATTAMTGLIALQQGWLGTTGLITATPPFAGLKLRNWGDWVIGGHDIRPGKLYDEAYRMCGESHAIDGSLLEKCRPEFEKIEQELRPGSIINCGPTISKFAESGLRELRETPHAAIARLQGDLRDFQARHQLEHVVVVYVASTEPVTDSSSWPATYAQLEPLLDDGAKCPLPASCLYAIAALDLGCSFINFTPSLGATPAAIQDLAIQRKSRHYGYDGKTGETLLKSTLAPMFAKRNLDVMSWVGHNIFGNMDGKVLDDPINKKSKVTSKDRLLGKILGYTPQTLVSIEYIESMGDWKTAWDHIHFRGFLGTPMVMQFIWQGCDSILAAPLVLDLMRLTERAWRNGDTGALTFLAPFFKSPIGTDEHDFGVQFQMLEAWVRQTGEK